MSESEDKTVMDEIASQLAGLKIDNPVEEVQWLDNPNDQSPELQMETLCDWLTLGARNVSVADEKHFVGDPDLLTKLILTLSKLDSFSESQKNEAGKRVNMFESVGKLFFSTRSALKFANLDAIIKFTNPLDPTGAPLVAAESPIYFVDITNSTDYGFIEYMQWRKGEYASGFSFKHFKQDMNLWTRAGSENRPKSKLEVVPVSGDSKMTAVIRSFVKFVLDKQPQGAHLVCSDNLDVDQRFKGVREVLLKRPHMCNCILGLSTVGENGTFIIKVTHTFTRFMVGLLYLIRQHFREMAIFKPVTSRPANAEKYVVFRSKLPGTEAKHVLINHLLSLNDKWSELPDKDVLELVPLDILNKDRAFCDFIRDSNDRMTAKQIPYILQRVEQIISPKRSVNIYEGSMIREQCFRLWNLPEVDAAPKIKSDTLLSVLQQHKGFNELNFTKFGEIFAGKTESDLKDWSCAPIHTSSPTFFLSQDNKLSMWNGSKWQCLDGFDKKFPSGTVLYGELISTEYQKRGDFLHPVQTTSLHLIDIFVHKYDDYRTHAIAFRLALLRQLVNDIKSDSVYLAQVFPFAYISPRVKILRRNWKPVAGIRGKRLVLRHGSVASLPIVGLILFNSNTLHNTVPSFWNWSEDTHNVLNINLASKVNFVMFDQLRPIK